MRRDQEKRPLIYRKQFANHHTSGFSIKLNAIIKNCEQRLGLNKSFFVNHDVWYSRVSAILKIRGVRKLDETSLKRVSVTTYNNYHSNPLDPETSDHEYLRRVKKVYAEIKYASIFEFLYNKFIDDLDELLKGVENGKYTMNTSTHFTRIKEYQNLHNEYLSLSIDINPKQEKKLIETENYVKNYEFSNDKLKEKLNNLESELAEYRGGVTKTSMNNLLQKYKKNTRIKNILLEKNILKKRIHCKN